MVGPTSLTYGRSFMVLLNFSPAPGGGLDPRWKKIWREIKLSQKKKKESRTGSEIDEKTKFPGQWGIKQMFKRQD